MPKKVPPIISPVNSCWRKRPPRIIFCTEVPADSTGGFLGFGEKEVAIPYSALTYDNDEQYFTCAISKDRFANAPEFKDEAMLQDRSFAEEVYRYFGQQPYWTEESIGKSNSIDDSMGPGAWDFE